MSVRTTVQAAHLHPNDKQGHRKHRKMLRRMERNSVNPACKWARNTMRIMRESLLQ